MLGLALPASTQTTEAASTVRSFYIHDAVYNVTAWGNTTYDPTALQCDIEWNIAQGHTNDVYASLTAKLLLLADCSPALALENITTVTNNYWSGSSTMDVIATSHGNLLRHRMQWRWDGALDEAP